MKILVTGITGLCGGEVLQQCLRHPSITSVVALARRPLEPSIDDPKLNLIVIKDFLNYSEEVKKQLRGVDGCVWALGKPIFKNLDEAKEVTVGYAKTAMTELMAGRESNATPLRFVFLSGMFVERDQEKKLWWLADLRHVKGLGEQAVLDFGKESSGFEAYIARPAYVAPNNNSFLQRLKSTVAIWHVPVSSLAAAMIDTAVNGSNAKIIENEELVSRGAKVLNAAK